MDVEQLLKFVTETVIKYELKNSSDLVKLPKPIIDEFFRDLVILDRLDLIKKFSPFELSPDMNGETILHLAAAYGRSQIVEFLIKQKLDLEAQNNEGYTPVFVAGLCRNLEVVKLLLAYGANPSHKNNYGETLIHFFVRKNCLDGLKLIDPVKLNIQNKQKETPLHLAVVNNKVKITKYLLDNKVDTEIKNDNNKIPKQLCLQNSEISKLFFV
jgi:ankyrin repeat protein